MPETRALLLSLAAVAATAAPLLAQTSQQTRQELQQLRQRVDELSRQVASQPTSERGEMTLLERLGLSVGGYFDLEFRDEETAASTFDQHRFVLQFDGDILAEAMTFRSEIEIEGGGADASFLSDNEIVVEFAEVHFHLCQEANIKVGALLVPFGRFNRLHDSPLRDLTDRPLVDRRIIPTTWTDSGIGCYGNREFGGVGFDYDVILSNGLDDDFSSTLGGGFRSARNSLRSDNNDNKMVIGRVGVSPAIPHVDHAGFGFSFGFGKYDDSDDQSMELYCLDWTVKSGPFELIGEWAEFDLERGPAEIAAGAPGRAGGVYAQVNYHFFPDSWRGQNKFFTDESTFTLALRYDSMDTDGSMRGIDRGTRGSAFRDDAQRYTFGLNFRPIEKTVIKFEYQLWDETGRINGADNNRFVISVATYL